MTPRLDAALLYSSRAGSDLGCKSDRFRHHIPVHVDFFFQLNLLPPYLLRSEGDNKINQVFLIFITRELSVNKKDPQSLTLMGPTTEHPVPQQLTINVTCNRNIVYSNKSTTK